MRESARHNEITTHVRAGGHNLKVTTLNPPEQEAGAPTLVFLHEGLGNIDQWRDFPRLLAEATGLGALLYDRYGFGGSDPLQEPRGVEYLEQEAKVSLPELLDTCGVDAPILVGHSDGGTIGLLYAARFPDHPRGVITEAAHVFVEDVTIAGIHRAVSAYESGDLRQKLARFHGEKTDAIFFGWCNTWLAPRFRDWNIEAGLERIHCPLLAIQGKDDEYGTEAQLQAIAGRVSGPAESLLVPDCGHIPHHQAREAVLREMTRFVEQLK